MASRFLTPETRVLHISGGDTLVVKRRLNTGEQRQLFEQMKEYRADGTMRANPIKIGIASVVMYLVDWSLVDEAGKRVEISGKSHSELEAIVDGLDTDSFEEIRTAIDAHIAAQNAEREREKKVLNGDNESKPTSLSPSDAVGATSGLPS